MRVVERHADRILRRMLLEDNEKVSAETKEEIRMIRASKPSLREFVNRCQMLANDHQELRAQEKTLLEAAPHGALGDGTIINKLLELLPKLIELIKLLTSMFNLKKRPEFLNNTQTTGNINSTSFSSNPLLPDSPEPDNDPTEIPPPPPAVVVL